MLVLLVTEAVLVLLLLLLVTEAVLELLLVTEAVLLLVAEAVLLLVAEAVLVLVTEAVLVLLLGVTEGVLVLRVAKAVLVLLLLVTEALLVLLLWVAETVRLVELKHKKNSFEFKRGKAFRSKPSSKGAKLFVQNHKVLSLGNGASTICLSWAGKIRSICLKNKIRIGGLKQSLADEKDSPASRAGH